MVKFYTGKVVAWYEESPVKTIRHINCTFLQDQETRCQACSAYCNNLKSISIKKRKRDAKNNNQDHVHVSNHTNYRYMSKKQMQRSIMSMRVIINQKDIKINHLEQMIQLRNDTTNVDYETHDDLLTIMSQHHKEIIQSYPEDSFQHIFWLSQYNAAKANSPNGYRWNPAMIRWCIFLQQKSSKAYELIRKSKCIKLPSQRTLREYTNYTKASTGFSNDLDEQMICDSKLNTIDDHQKFVSIIADEMYIKEGLVYNKNSGNIVGYCDIGDINNHLVQLEQQYTCTQTNTAGESTTNKLAKTMLVLMVRCLFTSFTFPYVSFATSNLTGEQMVPIFYEAIMRVERCGFKVASITLDGNSVNRKFIKLISSNNDRVIKHKFKNPLSFNSRDVVLFSDPPHLIKTTRNCLASSKRNMKVHKKFSN